MNTVHVEYTCGHWRHIRVDLARNSTCPTCQKAVRKINTHEWRVRCPQCRYGRWCGQSQDEAEGKRTNHRKAHPTHWPSVAYDRVTYDGKGIILRWDEGRPRRHGPSGTLAERPQADDEPPF